MKKLIFVLAVFLIGAVPVYADMGAPPDNPIYTCVIGFNGAEVYGPDGEVSSQTLPGGAAFYVFRDYHPRRDDLIEGTTDASAKGSDSDKLVWIKKSDTLSASADYSPENGSKLEKEYTAETTDKLNLRHGPGTGFGAIKVLDKGTKVKCQYTFDTDTRWMYVTVNDSKGWVCGDYLKKTVKPAPVKDTSSTKKTDTEKETDNADSGIPVTGIIICCILAACLIAALVYFILRRKTKH